MKYKRADIKRCVLYGMDISEQDVPYVFLERWAAVYNLTRTIPDDRRFNMETWGNPALTECGTSACAAGHAMLHPWFRRRGINSRTAVYRNTLSVRGLQFTNYRFFGLSGNGGTPFSPTFCSVALNRPDSLRLSPRMVSEVIMAWMLRTWPADRVIAEIDEMKSVSYDMEFVHNHAPWMARRRRA